MDRQVTKNLIIEDLKRIGIEDGDHVAVALSFKSVGHVEGGPEIFIDALLEVVGPNGTIMMNTHTHGFPLSRVASDYIFDHKLTPAWTGLVPETMRKRKNSLRSLNPICSVTAIGKFAEHLTKGHDENSSLYLPYSRLAEVGGKYLCIGLGNDLVAIRHEPQRLAGFFDVVPMFCGVKYVDRRSNVRIYIYKQPPCNKKLPELVHLIKKTRAMKIGRIGKANSILVSAKDFIEVMTDMLRKDPTLTLCDRIHCLWCREFERRLNLYGKISNPRYFQKNAFIRATIAMINRFRMKEFSFLLFQNGKGDRAIKESKLEYTTDEIKRLLRIPHLIVRQLLN